MSSDNIVKLNIGGTVFQTMDSTLTKFDGMFKTMLETDVPVKKDESGCIFIDRSPKHFEVMLNFMRDGDVNLPMSEQNIQEIKKEAQYYSLDDLVKLCNANIPKRFDTWEISRIIKSPIQYDNIISKRTKPVLILQYAVYPDFSISYPEGFDLRSFSEKHDNIYDMYLKPFKTEKFDTTDSRWSWYVYRCDPVPGKNWFETFCEMRRLEMDIESFWKH